MIALSPEDLSNDENQALHRSISPHDAPVGARLLGLGRSRRKAEFRVRRSGDGKHEQCSGQGRNALPYFFGWVVGKGLGRERWELIGKKRKEVFR